MKRRLFADKLHTTTVNPVVNQFSSFLFSKLSFTLLKSSFVVFALFFSINILAQQNNNQQQEQYINVITQRSAKIVKTLNITDSVIYKNVLAAVVNQYTQLNSIHEQSNIATGEIKQQSLTANELAIQLKREDEKKSSLLLQHHNRFLAHIREFLTEAQVEQVKDGMTYRILPVTYAAYLEMILTLTTEQKAKIYSWLSEARELAMDEGSSEAKHKVFGKYKGKINNYLSAQGFDMKAEEKGWQQRLKEKKEKNGSAKNLYSA